MISKNIPVLLLSFLLISCDKKEDELEPVQNTNTSIPATDTSVTPNPAVPDYFLNISVTDFKSQEGKLNVAIFNSEQNFDDKTNWVLAAEYDVASATVDVQIKNLPSGEYAVSVYHDKNDNNELDQNFLGIPTEGFGFSNNAMGTFGPPSFDQAKIQIDSGVTKNISIDLVYF